MSIRIMSDIWRWGPNKQSERFVLIALADYANDEGECWPSINGIAKKTCLTSRGVQSIIRRLEKDEWISIDVNEGRRGCNLYTIKTDKIIAPAQDAPPAYGSPPPLHITTPPPAYGSPEPSLTIKEEPSIEKNTKKENPLEIKSCQGGLSEPPEIIKPPEPTCKDYLQLHVSEQVAENFIAYRKEIKKPLTPRSAKSIAKILKDHSNPEQALDQSIANRWTGVFAEKKQTGGTRNGNGFDGEAWFAAGMRAV